MQKKPLNVQSTRHFIAIIKIVFVMSIWSQLSTPLFNQIQLKFAKNDWIHLHVQMRSCIVMMCQFFLHIVCIFVHTLFMQKCNINSVKDFLIDINIFYWFVSINKATVSSTSDCCFNKVLFNLKTLKFICIPSHLQPIFFADCELQRKIRSYFSAQD